MSTGLSLPRLCVIALATLSASPGCRRGTEIDAPAPPLLEDTEQPPALPYSVLNVPVRYDLRPILEDLEGIVPRRFGDLEERHELPSNRRVEFAFDARRDPFRADLDGDTARLSAVIHYRGRGWYDPPIGPTISASCGAGENDPPRRAVIAMSAPIGITPDWTLEARSRLHRVSPVSDQRRDECRITIISVDITERLMEAVGNLIRRNTPALDRAVAGVDVRSEFENLWRLLQTPIELTDSVWLLIDPVAVRKGRVTGDSLIVTANVGLSASPRIVVGRKPAVEYRPLPPLEEGEVEEGLAVLIEGVVDYRLASDFIARELVGRSFERANRRLRITSARIYGTGGGRLALELGFAGSARGHVYFVGTPELDARTRQVTIPDLDVEISSADLLLRGVAWLSRSSLVDFLRERAVFPVDDPIALGERYLHEGLNRSLSDDVRLSGEVLDVQPIGVHATREALFIRARATARARLDVSTKDPGEEARQ